MDRKPSMHAGGKMIWRYLSALGNQGNIEIDLNYMCRIHLVLISMKSYASGVAARSDIVQAQSLVDVSQAQAIDNGVARAKFEHAIALLIGQPASCFTLTPDPLNIEQPVIPVYVPVVFTLLIWLVFGDASRRDTYRWWSSLSYHQSCSS